MALGNYTQLQAAITTYSYRDANDTSFTNSVSDFITLAEARINRALRVAEMEKTGTVNLTNGAATLPTDFLEMRRVVGPSGQVLHLVPPELASTAFPTNVAGWSRYYSIVGNAITSYPAGTGDLTLTYYGAIPALTVGSPTNWLLTKAPDLYLYGALIESVPFQMDDQRLPTWTSMFQAALADVQRSDKGKRWAGGRMRVSGPTP